MAVTNNLKNIVDLPVWEWLRFAPATTSATSALTTADDSSSRYAYYINAAALWRYDFYSDAWQQLGSPPTATSVGCSLRYTVYGGVRGKAISGTSTSITIGGVRNASLNGYKIRIISGTGAGQERTITGVADQVCADSGVVTATTSATQMQDTVKKWKFNQWVGYTAEVIFGTGQIQHRKVLFNDATTLYFNDVNYQAIDHWNNTGFSIIAPYAAPASTAGAQSYYQIFSQQLTVNSAWTVTPDATSRYAILSGGLWLLSSAAAPFYTMQFYDIATDVWYTKSAIQGLLSAAATDFTMERLGEVGGSYLSSTATAGGLTFLTDSTQTMPLDRYAKHQIRITGGTGVGQRRTIIGNNATSFYVNKNWDTNPSTDSTYSIYPNTDRIFAAFGGYSQILGYSVENDMWFQGDDFDHGTCNVLAARLNGHYPVAITSITRNTGGITAVNPVPTAGGTGYVVGDILTVSTGGTLGKVRVTSVTNTPSAGIVTGIELFGAGLTYTTGTAKATTGGTGTACTVEITAIGVVGRVVTATNHYYKIGDTVTISGATDSAYNVNSTIIGCDALLNFDITVTAAATAIATKTLATTLIVDTSKNWTTNEHVGKLVQITANGTAPVGQVRRITANDATSLTVAAYTTVTPTPGQTRYVIHELPAFGRETLTKIPGQETIGWATGGSTTTLVDSTKSWIVNMWAGFQFRILTGAGANSELTIVSNTATTLTYTTQSFTPDATSKYMIYDTFGMVTTGSTTLLTDSTKNWTVNILSGKRFKVTGGGGQNQELAITASAANNASATITTTTDLLSSYTVFGVPIRSTGMQAQWVFNCSDVTQKGKYMWVARAGGSNIIDRYDITTNTWLYGIMLAPQAETLSTGSMYSYDGDDRIYFTKDNTGRVYSVNVLNNRVDPSGVVPYGMSTAIIGNRFEVIETVDGLKYLYVMRHTATEMWRTLIFW